MTLRIEDYALIGDTHTGAIVGLDGSIDWLCFPRFDSPACFASLLGTEEHGSWRIAPVGGAVTTTRRYRPGTLVLETDMETADGVVRVVDCMPARQTHPRVVRVVEGLRGSVPMSSTLAPLFDYGKTVPWIKQDGSAIIAGAGPEALELRADPPVRVEDHRLATEFDVREGEHVGFVLSWYSSWEAAPPPIDALAAVDETDAWWREWSARSTYRGGWKDEVERSLITLKALTYEPTGGVVAAATTSLPEFLGGVRNWDYRFCWIRDAALTLDSLMAAGYVEEATKWRDWVIRAVAGDPEDLQIMYGVAGERRLDEYELDWLPGYEGSAPVRVGNAASGQRQLDVYGELIDAIYRARQLGMTTAPGALDPARGVIEWLEANWRDPDDGVWEVRGPRRQFVHSKVMAWVAADRAVKIAEEAGLADAIERLTELRDAIHDEVCKQGFDADRNTFTQYYGSSQLDAALLLIPQVGFLPPSDPRVVGTVEAVQAELVRDGFVMRYIPDEDAADGLPPGEGAFLACSFWLVIDLAMIGRLDEARELFERLLSLRNDLGLFSEEYDQQHQRLIGNFPQAFTHLTLIAAAVALTEAERASSSDPT
jgi:GH15 family glucan-1,4-alpha-glucosidase